VPEAAAEAAPIAAPEAEAETTLEVTEGRDPALGTPDRG
jgi:hypothetical protein